MKILRVKSMDRTCGRDTLQLGSLHMSRWTLGVKKISVFGRTSSISARTVWKDRLLVLMVSLQCRCSRSPPQCTKEYTDLGCNRAEWTWAQRSLGSLLLHCGRCLVRLQVTNWSTQTHAHNVSESSEPVVLDFERVHSHLIILLNLCGGLWNAWNETIEWLAIQYWLEA